MGLLRVFFGIESASEAGLESIGRVQTVLQSKRVLDMCRELDISSQYERARRAPSLHDPPVP